MLAIKPYPHPAAAHKEFERALNYRSKATAAHEPTTPSLGSVAAHDPTPPGLPCLEHKPKGVPFGEWLTDVLVRRRGVLASLPRSAWPSTVTETDSTSQRIVGLDTTRCVGQAWWWMWRLRESRYMHHKSHSPDAHTSIYATDGLEDAANSWLPTNAGYDALVTNAGFDEVTCAGFATSLRMVPPPANGDAGTLDKLSSINQRVLLELEAAANGIAPAILALMIVNANDDLRTHRPSAMRLQAQDEVQGVAPLTNVPGHVAALVSVSQVHSFCLSDVLAAYNRTFGNPLLRPSIQAASGSLHEMTAAVARKVRALARSRVLKLNITPTTVVFCPHLIENDETGELEAQGYCYDGIDGAKGVPFMSDFDPLYTRRVSAQHADWDVDGAYSSMMLSLLATVRAQYGEAPSSVMMHKLLGRGPEGAQLREDELPLGFSAELSLGDALERSRPRVDGFSRVIQSMAPTASTENAGDDGLAAAFAGVASDFRDVVVQRAVEGGGEFDTSTNVFGALINTLTTCSRVDSALFAPPTPFTDLVIDCEQAEAVREGLKALQMARSNRRR